MAVLTNLIAEKIRKDVDTVDGKTTSKPVLNYGDGTNTTYSVDVDIGEDQLLRSVPLAAGNNSLIYAEVGSAVKLTKSATGRFEVTAFSKRLPGLYERVPMTLPDIDFGSSTYSLGDPEDLTYFSRPLTYDELGTIGGGYGNVVYGAVGIWKGGVLVEVN